MKTVNYVFFFFFMFTFMTNCNKKEDNVKSEFELVAADNLDDNEYQIYSLILDEKYTTSNYLLIEQETFSSSSISFGNNYYESLKTENPNLDTTIFGDFIEKNDKVHNLDKKFNNSTRSIVIISSEEIKYFFNSQDLNKDWNEFYENYPSSNGFIKFARVGFNVDKSQGIVEIGHYYGSLGADGFLIYVVKENNTWRIVEIINTWVS